MNRTLIIGEAGVNHNGSLEMALQLVDVAADAGANFVKFQTFNADRLASAIAPKAEYQKNTTGHNESQLAMLRRLELSEADHHSIVARCGERGIGFLSSPFDIESLWFLTRTLDLDLIKLGSGELTNAPLLIEVGRSNRRVIISTGMATLGEVEDALGALAFGYSGADTSPTRAAMTGMLHDAQAWAKLWEKVTILHCTTEYPTPPDQINLRAMETLRSAFGIPVGFSDHTAGTSVAIAATAMGAVMIEKHLTLSRDLPGPDHMASLEPAEFASMVSGIREAEAAFGTGNKQPQACEIPNIGVARKSIVALRAISAGETLTTENLGIKRPGTGLSPFGFFDLLGTNAPRNMAADEAL